MQNDSSSVVFPEFVADVIAMCRFGIVRCYRSSHRCSGKHGRADIYQREMTHRNGKLFQSQPLARISPKPKQYLRVARVPDELSLVEQQEKLSRAEMKLVE